MTDEARVWGKEMTSSRLSSQEMVEVGFKTRAHLPPKLMEISANIPHGGKPTFMNINTCKALYMLYLSCDLPNLL